MRNLGLAHLFGLRSGYCDFLARSTLGPNSQCVLEIGSRTTGTIHGARDAIHCAVHVHTTACVVTAWFPVRAQADRLKMSGFNVVLRIVPLSSPFVTTTLQAFKDRVVGDLLPTFCNDPSRGWGCEGFKENWGNVT